jgi:hypothetical protein
MEQAEGGEMVELQRGQATQLRHGMLRETVLLRSPFARPISRSRRSSVPGRQLRRSPGTTIWAITARLAGWDSENATSVNATERLRAALRRLRLALAQRRRSSQREERCVSFQSL